MTNQSTSQDLSVLSREQLFEMIHKLTAKVGELTTKVGEVKKCEGLNKRKERCRRNVKQGDRYCRYHKNQIQEPSKTLNIETPIAPTGDELIKPIPASTPRELNIETPISSPSSLCNDDCYTYMVCDDYGDDEYTWPCGDFSHAYAWRNPNFKGMV